MRAFIKGTVHLYISILVVFSMVGIMMVFTWILNYTFAITCPSGTSSSSKIISMSTSITGESSPIVYSVKSGPVSNALYYQHKLS